ncbi:MAG TPA: hypothetical protein VEX13_09865, partial [Chloroflexia bacterium]|nr:hypothetical protein [Chloroflexia bacterium]
HDGPPLLTGSFTSLYGQDGVYALLRELDGQQLIAAFNANRESVTVNLPLQQNLAGSRRFSAVWGESGEYIANEGMLASVSIPARQGVVLSGAL